MSSQGLLPPGDDHEAYAHYHHDRHSNTNTNSSTSLPEPSPILSSLPPPTSLLSSSPSLSLAVAKTVPIVHIRRKPVGSAPSRPISHPPTTNSISTITTGTIVTATTAVATPSLASPFVLPSSFILPKLKTPVVPRKPIRASTTTWRTSTTVASYSPIPEESSEEVRLDAEEGVEVNSLRTTIHSGTGRTASSRSWRGPWNSDPRTSSRGGGGRGWGPSWLRRGRVFGMVAWMTGFMVAALVVVIVGGRDGGLGGREWVWTVCSLAVVSLTLLVWGRMEHQALRYMPWILASRTATHYVDQQMDYLSKFFLASLFSAIRRGHWFVVLVITIRILLFTEILLTAVIFRTEDMPVSVNTTVTLDDTIAAPDSIPTGEAQTAPFFAAVGTQQFDLPYPFGVSTKYAYQTFHTLDDLGGTNDVTAVVDGVSVSLSCLEEDDLDLNYEANNVEGEYTITISIPTDPSFTAWTTMFADKSSKGANSSTIFVASEDLTAREGGGPQMLLIQLEYEWETDPVAIQLLYEKVLLCEYSLPLSELEVTKTKAVGNQTTGVVIPVEDDSNAFHTARSLDIDLLALLRGAIPNIPAEAVTDKIPTLIRDMALFQGLAHADPEDLISLTSEDWQEGLTEMFQTLTPFLLHAHGRQPTKLDPIDATTTLFTTKTSTHPPLTYALAALFAVKALLLLAIALFFSPIYPVSGRKPQTLLDLSIILSSGQDEKNRAALGLEQEGGLGGGEYSPGLWIKVLGANLWGNGSDRILGWSSSETVYRNSDSTTVVPDPSRPTRRGHGYGGLGGWGSRRRRPQGGEKLKKRWSPWILRSKLRTVVLVAVYAVAAGLIALVMAGNGGSGFISLPSPSSSADSSFGSGSTETLISSPPVVMFKLIPTGLFLLFSIYAITSSNTIKFLTPFTLLAERHCDPSVLATEFADTAAWTAIQEAVRHGAPSLVLGEIAATAAGFAVIVAGGLFGVREMELVVRDVRVRQTDWFAASTTGVEGVGREVMGLGMFLTADGGIGEGDEGVKYPAGAYEDLLFFGYEVKGENVGQGGNVTATVHAMRLEPTCTRYRAAEVLEVVRGQWDDIVAGDGEDYVVAPGYTVEDTGCGGDLKSITLPIPRFENNGEGNGTMSFATTHSWDGCPKAWYVFGAFDAGTETYFSADIWECHFLWSELLVRTNLLGLELEVDHDSPPSVEGSVKRARNDISLTAWENPFPEILTALDDEEAWDMDTEVRWAVAEDSGSGVSVQELEKQLEGSDIPSQDVVKTVVEHSAKNRAIIAAQMANIHSRLALDKESAESPSQLDEDTRIEVEGTLQEHSAKRVVINEPAVYLLMVSLIILIIVNAWALLGMMARRFGARRGGYVVDMDMVGLLRENPGSLDGMARLIKVGNLGIWMPGDLGILTEWEVREALAGRRLRLGWFWDSLRNRRVFALAVAGTGDGELVFVGERVVGGSRR